MQHTRNICAATAAPFRTPSLTRFLDAKYVQSVKPTTARTPVESSANSTPFVPSVEPADDLDALAIFMLPRADFDPRVWAVHLKMLAKPGTSVRKAQAEVKKEFRAPARGPRAKATRPAKAATATDAGATA